jgi:hypothetical protein
VTTTASRCSTGFVIAATMARCSYTPSTCSSWTATTCGVSRSMCAEHIEGDGETLFHHACKLGLEGIVSKRKDSPYRSGRSPDWLKMKNAEAPPVKREAEEDWGRRGR